ncbi:hypothetical protein GCM10009744_62440 [Kribbella alba]|uniref:Uncharacterized protein n=1 Tax=Kribbella alba TaxID=190197 RepID=A0ABN2FVH3_9ACTN
MDWSEAPRSRLLAAAYLAGFALWLAGVLWILYNEATGGSAARMTVGIVLFALGQLIITILAFALRARFPGKLGTNSPDGFSRAWQRLSAGLELPPALRLLLSR